MFEKAFIKVYCLLMFLTIFLAGYCCYIAATTDYRVIVGG